MRQYETAIRIAQVHHLADERKYKKALTVIQTLDMRQVRNLSDLKVFAEVYIRTEQFSEAKATYLKIYKKSRTRRILYRLIYLAIRTNDLGEAEKYYTEFLRMNPSERDALIVRYRIDKASGVPIGQMIDTLKHLKEEEYIEEWAYELAKLYQQAGRYEECREECEDIKLWFGSGEIVERAKLLLEHIQENDPMPFLDDTDFTEMIPREEPNPEDTGSLPDLSEYLESNNEQEMKLLKKVDPAKFEEIASEKIANEEIKAGGQKSSVQQTVAGSSENMDAPVSATDNLSEPPAIASGMASEAERPGKTESTDKTDIRDDAEKISLSAEDKLPKDGETDVLAAKEASKEIADSNTSGETLPVENAETAPAAKESAEQGITSAGQQTATEKTSEAPALEIDPGNFPRISQSGTGITQDLAKEISAIYEAERQAQLKEKSVTVMQEVPNVANQVVERLTEAAPQSDTKTYTPLDMEEINRTEENLEGATIVIPSVTDTPNPKEAFVPLPEELPPEAAKKEPSSDLEAELKLLKALEEELKEAETKAGQALEAGGHEEIQKAKITAFENHTEEKVAPATAADVIAAVDNHLEQHISQNPAAVQVSKTEPMPATGVTAPIPSASQATSAAVSASQATPSAVPVSQAAPSAVPISQAIPAPAVPPVPVPSAPPTVTPSAAMEAARAAVPSSAIESAASVTPAAAIEAAKAAVSATVPPVEGNMAAAGTGIAAKETAAAISTEQPQQESATGEVLQEKDLPTTRALHRSFADILILIGGEMDPSHFVLMGDGRERILGIAKKISVVMRETGYLSSGRIAHIAAQQLNQMDIAQFKKQLKGNCLLITGAAELLFPTITKVFSVMDEFYGDFTVILSDEGSTLDQLFRFVPALSRRFKYVIDISQYTEQDYK